jgi:hypothetical protein
MSDRVKEIRERLSAASEGRWILWRRERKGLELVWVEDESGRHVSGTIHHPDAEDHANATLIAAAPADLAWLLEERETLLAEVARLRDLAYTLGSKPLPEGATRGYVKEKP